MSASYRRRLQRQKSISGKNLLRLSNETIESLYAPDPSMDIIDSTPDPPLDILQDNSSSSNIISLSSKTTSPHKIGHSRPPLRRQSSGSRRKLSSISKNQPEGDNGTLRDDVSYNSPPQHSRSAIPRSSSNSSSRSSRTSKSQNSPNPLFASPEKTEDSPRKLVIGGSSDNNKDYYNSVMPPCLNINSPGMSLRAAMRREASAKRLLLRQHSSRRCVVSPSTANSNSNSSSSSNSNSSSTTPSIKKQLRFSDAPPQVYEIQSIHRYASRLWWTEEEFVQSEMDQADISKDSPLLQRRARQYTEAYSSARFAAKSPNNNKTTALAKNVFADLVNGVMVGYLGLEVFTPIEDERLQNVSNIVLQIVSTSKQAVDEKELRSFSESLTKNDKLWAAVMGNVCQTATAPRKRNQLDDSSSHQKTMAEAA